MFIMTFFLRWEKNKLVEHTMRLFCMDMAEFRSNFKALQRELNFLLETKFLSHSPVVSYGCKIKNASVLVHAKNY